MKLRDNRRKMLVIRGIPGSGKSTFVECLRVAQDIFLGDPLSVVSADLFFDEDGIYNFDPKKIGKAHEWCQNNARNFMRLGHHIVVDNTNIKQWEMDPYRDLAKEFNYEFRTHVIGIYHLIEAQKNVSSLNTYADTCFRRNSHGVPLEKIKQMIQNFEW